MVRVEAIKKWGSKSPDHAFPPGKGIGELISGGMLAEWAKMSIGLTSDPSSYPSLESLVLGQI